MGVESLVFNTRIDDMWSDSNQSVQSGYHSYAGGPAVPVASGTQFTEQNTWCTMFSGTEWEKDIVRFVQWLHAISDARKNFNEQLVRASINKSRVWDAADAFCCLPPEAMLDDIIEKFKWLYGSMESFNTLMQQFCQIVQGKSERVQTFCPSFRMSLKGD